MNKKYQAFVIESLLCLWTATIFVTWFTLEAYPPVRTQLSPAIQNTMDSFMNNSRKQIVKLVWRDYVYSNK